MTIHRRALVPTTALVALAALTACAGATGSSAASTAGPVVEDDGHGAIAGAAEMPEPPLALLSVDRQGTVGILDLLDGTASEVGSVGVPLALASDGRFGFVTIASGLGVVDSGRWSWDHGDHFHYYLAEPRQVGTVPGSGPATVTTGMLSTTGSTGVFFAGSGEAVLLENSALADGEIVERFRLDTDAPSGVVAPLQDGALVTDDGRLVFHDATGAATSATAECADPAGALATRVGVVVGCADGAVLATWGDGAPVFERILYPPGIDAPRATSFDARKGRPTIAAVAGTVGLWLLDTRERAWRFLPTETPLARVAAVDDADGHVVGLDAAGRVRVLLAETGEQIAATEPIMTEVDPAVSLTVDGQRAYVNDPAAGVVHEIDYADDARVARTLMPETAATFVAEVGR